MQDAEKALAVTLDLVERELPKLMTKGEVAARSSLDGLPSSTATYIKEAPVMVPLGGEENVESINSPALSASMAPEGLSMAPESADASTRGASAANDSRSASPSSASLRRSPLTCSLPKHQQAPWLAAAAQSLPIYKEGDDGLGTIAEARRFTMPTIAAEADSAASQPPSHVNLTSGLVDAEIAGLVYDLVHLSHEALIVLKDGPLPGAGSGLGAKQVREAALQRLRSKPLESQKHVAILEAAKKQLNRLVGMDGMDDSEVQQSLQYDMIQ